MKPKSQQKIVVTIVESDSESIGFIGWSVLLLALIVFSVWLLSYSVAVPPQQPPQQEVK